MKFISSAVTRGLILAARRSILRLRLRQRDFTIVSNNCWGGHVYRLLGEEYRTPFVGLFIEPECYLTLLKDFHEVVHRPLKFVKCSRYERINTTRAEHGNNSPIGLLGEDVELHFVHYASEAEAQEKWYRRLGRMTTDEDQTFFKFCDRDGCTPEQLAEFDALPLRNKVCFVVRENHALKCGVWIPDSAGNQVPDGRILGEISPRFFDCAAWLNGGTGVSHWPKYLRVI